MVLESLEKYVLDSGELAYENTRQQAQMGFIASGGEFHDSGNTFQWADQKHPSSTILNFS